MSLTCHLKGVSNSYGGRVVLEPADYEFPPGKITCIIGPNGSGKSTLLGIAPYLVKPDAGTVEYNDGGSPYRRPVLEEKADLRNPVPASFQYDAF